jgi:hypothetical protein
VGDFSGLSVLASTITGNVGGDGIRTSNALMTLGNTILANNLNGDCRGTVSSTGYNLVSIPAGCTIVGDTTGNIIGVDPMLGPLAFNGGPTQTHALLTGSPAIDAGAVACPPPATDQRGIARPQDGDGDGTTICDIGAFEVEGSLPPTATPTPTATATPTATPTPGCLGDVNGDRVVDVRDLVGVARHMGSRAGGRRYDPRFDLNHDGRVNVVDLLIVLKRRGTVCR